MGYQTQVHALTTGAGTPPIADAEPAVRSGYAPLEVRFDAAASRDPDGSIADYSWDFGDGSTATDRERRPPTYTAGGRDFPRSR